MIFRAVLAHYAIEFDNKPSVCVNPNASMRAFFPMRAGMLRADVDLKLFREDDLNQAFKVARQHAAARVRLEILPRNFRLSRNHNCGEALAFLAPAIHGDLAFVEVEYHRHVEGAAGGYTQLVALRRKGSSWRPVAVQTLAYTN